MPAAQKTQALQFPGYSFNAQAVPVTGTSMKSHEIPLAAVPTANAGTLTTRTGDGIGVATLDAAHTIVSADVVDVYWATGRRYGMVATKSGAEVTLDDGAAGAGGAGDALPAQTTAVVVVKQTELNFTLTGDSVQAFAVMYRNAGDANARASADLQDSSDATIEAFSLVREQANGGLANAYFPAAGDDNPLAGEVVTQAYVSHGSTTSAGTLYILALVDVVVE